MVNDSEIVKARLVAALSESGYELLHTATSKRNRHHSDYDVWGKEGYASIIIEDDAYGQYGQVFFNAAFPVIDVEIDIEAIIKRIRGT